LRSDAFSWRESAEGVLDFQRGPGLRCVVNVCGADVVLDPGEKIRLASSPIADGVLPPDTAVWSVRD
jgi:alpha-glucosidase